MTTTLTSNLPHFEAFARRPALIDADHAPQILTMVNNDVRTQVNTNLALDQMAGAYGLGPYDSTGKSFIFGGGIAIIPVWGALLHRDRWVSPWATGYSYIERALTEAMEDDDVKGIVWDVNSYGGHVAGNFELCQQIAEAAKLKPMLSIVDARALSGGYSIPTATGRIIATPSADIGSIGVVMMHTSYEKMLDDAGISVTFVFAGEHKVDGNPYKDLPDNVRKRLQADVDRSYQDFVSLVAVNRGVEETAVKATEAAVYGADEAKALGLIDDVMQPRAAFAAFQQELESGSTPSPQTKKAMTMSTEQKNEAPSNAAAITQEQVNKAASDARAAEQARIKGITTHAEAAGRESLANHFAYDTSMSVEDAAKALAAAPKAAAQTAAAAEPTKETNRLAAAMEEQANRSVGANGGKDGEEEEIANTDRSARLVRNHALAHGRTVDKK